MRFFILITLFCLNLFSVEVTAMQLQLLQSQGYSQEDIKKALAKKSQAQEEPAERKEQAIQNFVESKDTQKQTDQLEFIKKSDDENV